MVVGLVKMWISLGLVICKDIVKKCGKKNVERCEKM